MKPVSGSQPPDEIEPEISVILPVKDGADHVAEMISSLLAQVVDAPWELVVVDNRSTDASAEIAQQTLDENDRPSSLARASVVSYGWRTGHASPRNHGVAVTSGRILIFCDADDTVPSDWLSMIAAGVDRHGFVASRQLTAARYADEAGAPQIFSERPPEKFGFPVAATGGLGILRGLFAKLGGFDPYFDRGGADADFSIRAARSGYVPRLADGAVYICGQRATATSGFSQGYRYGRSQIRLRNRHGLDDDNRSTSAMQLLRRYLRLAWDSPALASPNTRPIYARNAGWTVGRTVWALRLDRSFF